MPAMRRGGEARNPNRRRLKPPAGTVAFLFTDIEGSTRLARSRPDEYEQLLDRHRSILRDAFARHGGFEVGTEGDSFFVVFGSPVEAVRAAAEGQAALTAGRWPKGADVRVRMGLHLGEATQRDGDYVGLEIHRAARIGSAGHGGQVLVSGPMVAVIGDRFPDDLGVRELGDFRLKDFDAPASIYQLLGPGLPADFPALSARPVRLTNLPERRSSFIGRRDERVALGRALRANRLVTLTGPGGSGKTSLAVEAAHEYVNDYADGVWLAELAALREPDFVVTTIGHVLGLAEDPSRPAGETLANYLSRRTMLLVLDNLEQLLPDVARLVDYLLEAATGLRVLATSREPLHVVGEQELPLSPLDLPEAMAALDKLAAVDAVRLFLERARAVDPRFALSDTNRTAVVAIVRRLDGLPLAIELAAARVKLLSPAEILERLAHGSGELGQSGAVRPERQRTLREAIGWSYRLLPGAEQAFFARLSVFGGGCTHDSADQVCNPAGELAADSLETLGSLVDKSLLRRTESAAGSRFEMLETIRDYAREQLKAVDPDGLTASRHARHMLSLAEAAASELTKADGQWRTRLGAEIDNLRSALVWTIDSGDADTGMRMCAALWRFWQMRAVLSEGREWCDRVLAIPQPSNPSSVHARALLAAGNLAYWQRDPAAANRHYRQGLAEAEAMGGDRLQADALVDLLYLTRLYPEVADGDESEGLARRIKGLGKRLGDPVLGAQADFARAGPLVGQGQVAQAHPLVESARQVFEASGDLFLAAAANSIAGGLALTEGDLNEARKRTQRAAEFLHALGDEITLQMVLRTLALIAGRTGEPERAAQIHGFAARLVADTGGVRFDAPFESEDALELASRTIGRERADEEWRKGQQMTRDEAMAVARALGNSEAQP